MAAPVHKTRKALTAHGPETIELQEVVDTAMREIGYGNIKPDWQQYEVINYAKSVQQLRRTRRKSQNALSAQ